jgi:ribose transport system substrate-binding protein
MSKQDFACSSARKRFAVAGASLLSGALLVGGVLIAPTTAGADSNAIPAAQKKLKALEVRPTKIPVTTPIQGKIPTGKTIDWVVCGVPGCTVLTQPLSQAAAALGWKVVAIPGGLQPETILNAWNVAVQNKASGVVGTGFPESIFSSAVQQLNAAKTPAISAFVTDTPGPSSGLAAVVNGEPSYTHAGTALADIVLGTQGKSANAVFLGGTTFPASQFEEKAFDKEYKKLCSHCATSSIEEPATLTGDALTSSIVADLTRNPGINWVVASQPNDVYGLPSALKTAGLGKVKILVNTPDATTVNYLKQGRIAGINVVPNTDNMAEIIDAFARTYTGQSVAPDETAGGDWAATTPAAAKQIKQPYYLVPGYLAQYKKLWKS